MIIEGLESDGTKLLLDVGIGEVFLVGAQAYLVLERKLGDESSTVPAVNLSNGKVRGFNAQRDVKVANCKLVFEK